MTIGAAMNVLATIVLKMSVVLLDYSENHLPQFLKKGPVKEIVTGFNYAAMFFTNIGKACIATAEVNTDNISLYSTYIFPSNNVAD